jgi:hypothetical protein
MDIKREDRVEERRLAYQSVSSIATYIAAMAKMTWNQEY